MNGYKGNTGQNDMLKAYYKLIGEAHIENILDDLSKHEEEIRNTEVPESLNQWFTFFIQQRKKEEKRKDRIRMMKQFASRAAIITILLISTVTVVTFSVEAIRVRVLNFFLEVNDTYTEIQIQVEDNQQTMPDIDQVGYYYPTYLPDGYIYEDYRSFGKSVMITFSNGIEEISFDQSPNGASYQLDTEDAETRDVTIGESEGYLILKENRVILFWNDDLNGYTIISYDVEADEIMKMAESMALQE